MTRALFAVLLAVVLAFAQSAEQVITVDVDLVTVHVSVCDKRGRFISDLAPEKFSVFEDNVPQVITHFSRRTDAPLKTALLIDTSGSVRDKLDFEKQAAAEFLLGTLMPGRDYAAIWTFDSSIEMQQDYTDNPVVLTDAVRRTRAGGGTRLYDSLRFVMEETLTGERERKIIVLLTDGEDNLSRSTAAEVVETAQRHGVAIYAISTNAFGIPFNQDPDRADKVLDMIASETGGMAFFPKEPKHLPRFFGKISKEIRTQYTIAYQSTNATKDGSFRRIRIDVGNARYAVRARSGYYARRAMMTEPN
jgi:Ca-activated chloride channel family protein